MPKTWPTFQRTGNGQAKTPMWIIGTKTRLQNKKMCQVPRREQSSRTKWIFKWTVSPFRRTPLFGPADYFFRFGCFFLWPIMTSSRYSERGTRYLEQGAAPSLPNEFFAWSSTQFWRLCRLYRAGLSSGVANIFLKNGAAKTRQF